MVVRARSYLEKSERRSEFLSIRRAFVAALTMIAMGRPASAFDLFEVHVFHAIVNGPREFGLELHDNYAVAQPGASPDLAGQSRVLHVMLEPTFGILPGWEVGCHLQNAFLPDGTYDWGGAVLRTMYVFPHRHTPFVFGVNVEAGYVPPRYERSAWSGEIRAIGEYREGAIDIDVNVAFGVAFTGPLAGIPQVQPSVSARYAVTRGAALGVEYYADLGAVTDIAPVQGEGHYVFETFDVLPIDGWSLHVGVGEGLTETTYRWVSTFLLGKVF